MKLPPLAFWIFGLASCASPETPPATVAKVDLERYSGRWFELAAYPQPFQKDCASAMAEYGKPENGAVSVKNTCIKPDGSTRSISGKATPVAGSGGAKLLVTFDKWFQVFLPEPDRGNYWIFHVDPGYRHAIVGGPDRRSLWILSRSATVSAEEWERLMGIVREKGFDPAKLRRDAHTIIGPDRAR